MGHSQFAEIIGARGPNTQVNAACASTTQALSLAEDWIRAGRCRRVIVVSADDATGDSLHAVDHQRIPRERRRRHRRARRGRGDAVRPSAPRDDRRDGRRGVRRRVSGRRPRAWAAADLRGARRDHGQLGVPRHPSRRRTHRRRDGGRRPAGRVARREPGGDRRRGDVRVARDVHARPAAAPPPPRSTRCAGSSAPAPIAS